MAERFSPSGPLRGALSPPPDKSISHRAAIIAAMGEEAAEIDGYLDAADTRSTLAAVGALGAEVSGRGRNGRGLRLTIKGVGLRGAAGAAIDVGNAGTLMRLLPGWLAGQTGRYWTIDGDESIRRRPVDRIAEPLRLMGARVECREDRLPPLALTGAPLSGISFRLPVASAQVKSCLLLAGLLADGETAIAEPGPSRDHTELMLRAAGADVRVGSGEVSVRQAERLEPAGLVVPGDLSSAAFFIVAALLIAGSELRIEGVGLNPTRDGLIRILRRMGAEIEVTEKGGEDEPVGTLEVRASALRGTRVEGDEVPLAIDELPLVALAACFAEGETVIAGAGELRRKESDRVATVAEALNRCGGRVVPTADGFRIDGTGGLEGGRVSSAGDHRIAMLGAIAGVASRQGVEVDGMEAVGVSYPEFAADLAELLRK